MATDTPKYYLFPVEFLKEICGAKFIDPPEIPGERRRNWAQFQTNVIEYAFFSVWHRAEDTESAKPERDAAKLEQTAKHIGVTFGDHTPQELARRLARGARLWKQTQQGRVMVRISRQTFWEWRDKWPEQSEFYKDCFCAYIALRSLIGDTPHGYKPISTELLLARMCGQTSTRSKEYQGTAIYKTYGGRGKRRQMEALLLQLQEYWHIHYHVLKRRLRVFGIGDKEAFNAAMARLEAKPSAKSFKDSEVNENQCIN